MVDISHKRNLYRVIVGRDGVDLAKAIESLDDASRTKAAEIREKAALIQAVHLRGMTLETFLARIPRRTGTAARNCVQTWVAFHGECVMKCCSA